MLLELQGNIIYGPVRSRRLGASLGINILPTGKKWCSINCLYCQYGWHEPVKIDAANNGGLPGVEAVASALEKALRENDEELRYITFSGNGEATLHPEFDAIVDRVIALRDKWVPNAKTAILSNSTTVSDPGIRRSLGKLDVRIMKLDVGGETAFRDYNRPSRDIEFSAVVEGLALLEEVTLQVLFAGGPMGNFTRDNIEKWFTHVEKISPVFVQVYSLSRNSPTNKITRLEKVALQPVKERLNGMGIAAEVY